MRIGIWLSIFCLLQMPARAATPVDDSSKQEDPTRLASHARHIIQEYCYRCHNGTQAGGDLNFFLRKDLLRVGDTSKQPVVPSRPDQSHMIQRIVLGEMPPPGQPQPRMQDLSVLWQWIEAGAPEFPKLEKRQPTKLDRVLTAIRDDLHKAPPEKRPYLRYFTIHYAANNPELTADDLNHLRAALSKALNSLSSSPEIHRPEIVDDDQLVLAIDLRELGWDRNTWQRLIDAYPFAVGYNRLNADERNLADLSAEITTLTDCPVPMVRAGWFVATAMRPPLYYKLLSLPEGKPDGLPYYVADLEKQLGVETRANFQSPLADRIARAGFEKSGVSGQNRLVERQKSKYGYYWRSYDFLPDSPYNNLRLLPLGPLNSDTLFGPGKKNPFAKEAFKQDAGEIFFTLPNGLQGYMLVDGNDKRSDEGPVAVVSDSLKTSGSPAIVPGMSCIACHKMGIVSLEEKGKYKDIIRDHSAVADEDAALKIQQLFPDQKTMDHLISQDQKRYRAALEETVGPFLRTPETASRSLDDFPESLGEVARQYRLSFLDLAEVTRELDLDDPQKLVAMVGDDGWRELGLSSVAKDGGLITRLEWQNVDQNGGVSLMQKLSRKLGLGRVPILP